MLHKGRKMFINHFTFTTATQINKPLKVVAYIKTNPLVQSSASILIKTVAISLMKQRRFTPIFSHKKL